MCLNYLLRNLIFYLNIKIFYKKCFAVTNGILKTILNIFISAKMWTFKLKNVEFNVLKKYIKYFKYGELLKMLDRINYLTNYK